MNESGYIKFHCTWIQNNSIDPGIIAELNTWRKKIYERNWIGINPDGIGYGNISIRSQNKNRFIISGTNTGGFEELTREHYTEVTDFDLIKNTLTCQGPVKASSESLTHAAVYKANRNVGAVIHIHNLKMWEKLKDNTLTTSSTQEYGTSGMALEVYKLCCNRSLHENIIVMAGHESGLISTGKSLRNAAEVFLNLSI